MSKLMNAQLRNRVFNLERRMQLESSDHENFPVRKEFKCEELEEEKKGSSPSLIDSNIVEPAMAVVD